MRGENLPKLFRIFGIGSSICTIKKFSVSRIQDFFMTKIKIVEDTKILYIYNNAKN